MTREPEIGMCVRVKAKEHEEHVGAGNDACQKLETPEANSNEHIEMDGSRISLLQAGSQVWGNRFPWNQSGLHSGGQGDNT